MKNIIFGILVLFVGFGFIGCGDDGKDNTTANQGTITIINIPDEFNGMYGVFGANNPYLFIQGEIKNNNQRFRDKIENNSITLPLWMFENRQGATTIPFNGNLTITCGWEIIDGVSRNSSIRFDINAQPLIDDTRDLIWIFFPSVIFVNGRATLDWKNNSEIMWLNKNLTV